MRYRTLKASVVDLLGAAAAGRFRVVGYKPRGMAAEEALGNLRTVQVFYKSGRFPRGSSSPMGPLAHDVTLKIDLAVACATSGDLAALANPASTPAEYVAALESFQEGADLADASLDELADHVWNILLDGRNLDLGLTAGLTANRWIDSIVKGEPGPRGEYVVISGSLDLTCRVSEEILGDTGTPADPDLGAVYTELETNIPDSASADSAPAGIRAGGI